MVHQRFTIFYLLGRYGLAVPTGMNFKEKITWELFDFLFIF